MKKILALALAVLMLASCLLVSCGEKKVDGSSLNVCIASEPDTLDPALNSSVDGATMCAHLFQGIAKWIDNNGAIEPAADAVKELVAGTDNADGTVTYVYTLRDGLKWSDGKDVKASDFEYAWKRAASATLGADYGYMFDIIVGYGLDDVDGLAPLSVVADDAAKTLTVTLNNRVMYWEELLAFPAYYPVRKDVVADEAWATKPETYICNGPYTIDSWANNSVIVLKKNANFVDAASITMDTLNFYLSDDANNMLANFKNGSWQLIDDVPTNEIANLKTQYPTEFKVAGQIGTYYVCWNINKTLLPADSTLTGVEAEKANEEIRKALSLLLDRNYIVEEVAQGGQVPAGSFVAMGMTEADGKTEFYKVAGNVAGGGYYKVDKDSFEANFAEAVETLKKYYNYDGSKFTNAPALEYLYNTSSGHQAIGEYIQGAFQAVGITMNLTNQEWNTFLNTRKDGDYNVARNGWLADYKDPISFLDMWISESGNNDVQFGKDGHKDLAMYSVDLTPYGGKNVVDGTWAETYDVLIGMIKKTTDNTVRTEMLHLAEDLLMSTGCITPIYYYTDLYMIDDSVEGFFSNPLGYKYFMYCTVK